MLLCARSLPHCCRISVLAAVPVSLSIHGLLLTHMKTAPAGVSLATSFGFLHVALLGGFVAVKSHVVN